MTSRLPGVWNRKNDAEHLDPDFAAPFALRDQRTMVVCAEETPGCTETGAESAEMPQTRFNLIQIMLA